MGREGTGDAPRRRGVWVVVVAAGAGTRFGGAKQFEALGAARVLDWSVAVALAVGEGVVLVVAPDRRGEVEAGFGCTARGPVVVTGGATRSASVRAGLAAVPPGAATILVHDAARPLASPSLFERVIDAVAAGAPAVVPGVEVADSLRRRDGGPVDRDGLVAVQTPQGFAAAALRTAHRDHPEATDDATLVERHGARIEIVPGEPTNLKITTPEDLALARRLIAGGPR